MTIPTALPAEIDAALAAVKAHIESIPPEATVALQDMVIRLDDLSAIAKYRKLSVCEDWSARWCPVHGSCTCDDDGWADGEYSLDCPLHSVDSDHADTPEDNR